MSTSAIEVRIWGQRVGAVAPDPAAACYAFEYTPDWVRTGIELAPLTMPLAMPLATRLATRSPAIFLFPELPELTFRRLPGLLADALPDDFGNALVDAWMARKGVARAAITALDRLAYMGQRGLGALEFRPALGAARESSRPLRLKALVETARRVISGDLSDHDHAQAALTNIIRVGTSAGGARAKAVIAWNPQTDELRSGQFGAAPGFEHWLLKFDGVGKDLELGDTAHYGRIEYAYHLMTVAAGIVMQPSRLLLEGGRAHFMTRRFDRDGNDKHHIQTLCGLQHLDYKQRGTHAYEQLFLVARELGLGDEAQQQLFLRMAFNVLARNCDDHTKNFSFRLKQGGAWELAPAYDVTHAHNPQGEWTFQHLMSINGKFDNLTRNDLLTTAARLRIRKPADLLEQVQAAVAEWPRFAAEANLPEPVAREIGADHQPLK